MKTLLLTVVLAGGFVAAQAQQFSGSSTTIGDIPRSGGVIVEGDLTARRIGIGPPPTFPASPYLQFNNEVTSRKVVLYEANDAGTAPNDNRFYGLGINPGTLRFQIPASNTSFRFFRGDNPATSTEVFTITGTGNVGVGTPDPLNKLQVAGSIGQVSQGPFQADNSRFTAIGDPPGAFPTGLGRIFGSFYKSSLQSLVVGLASSTIINSDPANEPPVTVKRDAVIGFQDQTSTDPNVGNKLRIGFISGVAGSARFNERITVEASGFTGFGVLEPQFRVDLPNSDAPEGRIRANAFITYAVAPKRGSVQPITGATTKIEALRGVTWQKEDGSQAMGFDLAEVAKVMPGVVEMETDGKTIAGLNIMALTPMLVQSVQELNQRLIEKDQAIEALEARLNKLESGGVAGSLRTAPAEEISEGKLYQNQPNPFTKETKIEFELPATASRALLLIYDGQGKQVKSFPIVDSQQRSVTISAGDLPAGMYFYKMVVNGKVLGAKKMILTR